MAGLNGHSFDVDYADFRENNGRVHERALLLTPRLPNELELQARWFAGEFGREFTSTTGDHVELIQLGTWNRESGPDFRNAAVRINAGEPLRGSIEIDQLDRNWELHGHATNPAFDDTVLHVFIEKSSLEFFTRTLSHRNVPQVRIDPTTLPDAFSANLPLARPGRCCAPLRGLPEERVHSILDAAARFRLQRKSVRMRARIDHHGADETVFQEIAAALGYKENKLPFTLVAQRLPLRQLRQDGANIEALLFGVAGFLESPDLGLYQKNSRAYVKALWERWWPHRDGLQRLCLSKALWRISGTRPSNHPQRRLAALALLAQHWHVFRRRIAGPDVRAIEKFLAALDHPFWNTHYTLVAEPAEAEMALIGGTRIVEILANVLFPFWQTLGIDVWPDYAQLRSRLTNRRVETGAARLFGDDPRRADFLKTVAHQQGLLQIYEDFCLQDASDCSNCPFPEQMQKWT